MNLTRRMRMSDHVGDFKPPDSTDPPTEEELAALVELRLMWGLSRDAITEDKMVLALRQGYEWRREEEPGNGD